MYQGLFCQQPPSPLRVRSDSVLQCQKHRGQSDLVCTFIVKGIQTYIDQDRERQKGFPRQSSHPTMTLQLARRHVYLSGPCNLVAGHVKHSCLVNMPQVTGRQPISHVKHVSWQVTRTIPDFSDLLINEVPAQLIQGQRRKTRVQPTAVACRASDQARLKSQ